MYPLQPRTLFRWRWRPPAVKSTRSPLRLLYVHLLVRLGAAIDHDFRRFRPQIFFPAGSSTTTGSRLVGFVMHSSTGNQALTMANYKGKGCPDEGERLLGGKCARRCAEGGGCGLYTVSCFVWCCKCTDISHRGMRDHVNRKLLGDGTLLLSSPYWLGQVTHAGAAIARSR